MAPFVVKSVYTTLQVMLESETTLVSDGGVPGGLIGGQR